MRPKAPTQKNFGVAAAPPRERPAPRDPDFAIRDVSVHPVSEPESGASRVIVQITTAGGWSGYGEAPATPLAAGRLGALKPLLTGLDALGYVAIDQHLRSSPLAAAFPGAPAAVNAALLDIQGRAVKAPVYEVLGGRTRDKVRAMAVLAAGSPEGLRDEVQRAKAAGFRAFSVPLRIPEGPVRGRAFFRDARKLMDSLRAAAGEDSDFVLDCAGRITPGEGLSLAAALEDFHPLWLDEPAGELSGTALAQIAGGATTSVGYGRNFRDNARFQDLLREDAIDVLRPDITGMSLVDIRQAAALAETYYVAVAPFQRSGPIASAAALQLAAAIPNFVIQEVPFVSGRDRGMRDSLVGGAVESPVDGFFRLPAGPGLGITVDAAVLKQYRSPREEA